MADPILEFDPAAEASGTALTITTGNYGLTQFSAPSPPPKLQWAGSVDTEGSALVAANHENRTITVGLEVTGATALADLQSKLAKMHREGGTLKYTSPAGTANTYDVLVQDGWDPVFDHLHYLGGVTSCQFSLTCRPYGRGPEQDLGDNTETTLPALVFTEASIPGDVAALGRLVVDNDSSVDQWWLTWGLESRYYSSSANAALFYEAEGRTPLGGATAGAVASGASGTGITHSALTASYQAVMSTQATGGGAHLSHVGSFRVYARVQAPTTNVGLVTLGWEWSEGDFLRTTLQNETQIALENTNKWLLMDFGVVTLRPVTAGTQRWEGRIVARSTSAVGDDVSIDYLLFVPVAEGSGIVSGVERAIAPTAYVAEDHFTSTTAGNALNARVAPTGGTWATSGDATDLAFDDDVLVDGAGEHIKRTAVSGTNGRFAILGSTNYINTLVETLVYYTGGGGASWQLDQGVIARWTDSSNYLRVGFQRLFLGSQLNSLAIEAIVGGVTTTVASVNFSGFSTSSRWWKVRLTVTSSGMATASVIADVNSIGFPVGAVIATCSGSSSALATGGTLATGKPGIWDRSMTASATTRYYDDFIAATITPDAAAFGNQSIEIRHDRAQREDSGGTLWVRPSSYLGDYLLVPPSGAETRTTRMVVKMSRGNPAQLDSSIDDLSARLFVTPRYLAPPA